MGQAAPLHHTDHAGMPDELAGIEELGGRIGLQLMPWQRQALAVATQHDGDGRYLHQVVVVSVPRQSGKSTMLKALVLHRLTCGGLLGTWEGALLAQARQDAARFIVDWSEHSDALALKAYRGIGAERLHHGPNQLRAYAPSPTAMHSRSLDALLWDEAWSVDAERGREILQAAVPAMATRRDRQTWIVSTAGTRESVFLRDWVERGRNGARGVCLVEYGAPAGVDLDDYRAWPSWHPAFGLTQDADGIVQAREMFRDDEEGFRRAYANQWPEAQGAHGAIDPAHWAAAAGDEPELPEAGAAVLGLDVDPHALSASIAAAWRDSAGAVRVELVDHRDGVAWLLPRLRHLMDTYGVREVWTQDYGPVGATLDQLERERMPVQRIASRDSAAAVQAMLTAVRDGQVLHSGQQALTASALSIGTRPYGDGVQWQRRDAGATSPITAAGWAHWGLIRMKRRRRPRILVASA